MMKAEESEPFSLAAFKEHAKKSIRVAYETEHSYYKPADGSLATSLAEDVMSLIETQRNVLWDLTLNLEKENQRTFEDGMSYVLHCLMENHVRRRSEYFVTLQDCCAAANDFFRMSERMERFVCELRRKYNLSVTNSQRDSALQQLASSFVNQFSQDAVIAAERTQVYILREVQHQTNIPRDLFSYDWEDKYTQNEIVVQLVRTFDSYLNNTKRYLSNEYLYHKALLAAARALCCFYIRGLVNKAGKVGRRKHRPKRLMMKEDSRSFRSAKRALIRMRDDVCIISEFFHERTKGNVALTRMIRDEIATLEVIHECLGATDTASLESFIVVIHKRTGANALITRHFVADLYLLIAGQSDNNVIEPRAIAKALDQLQPDLQMVTMSIQEREPLTGKASDIASFVRLDEMLKALYEERIVNGLLPFCGPCIRKDMMEDCNQHVVARQIRNITRNVTELPCFSKKF